MLKIKKLLATVLVALMLICTLPLTAFAESADALPATTASETVDLGFTSFEDQKLDNIMEESSRPVTSVVSYYNALNLNSKGYHRTYLSTAFQRHVYDTVYSNFSTSGLTIKIPTTSLNGYVYKSTSFNNKLSSLSEELGKALYCYRNDNLKASDPLQYQYKTTYSVTWYTSGTNANKIKSAYFTVYYYLHSSYYKGLEAVRDNRIKEIANGAAQQKNLYYKLKYIHDEIVRTSYYDYDAIKDDVTTDDEIFFYAHSSFGILNKGIGVCEGYAKAFKLVCDYLNLAPVACLISEGDEAHMWNAVYLDDKWYCVDTTWDDPARGVSDYISYDYFLSRDPDVIDGSSEAHRNADYWAVRPNYSTTNYNPANHVHTPKTIPAVASTCVVHGKTAGSQCTACGEILTAPATAPLTPHPTTYINRVEPTFLKTGVYAHYKCTHCSALFWNANGTSPINAAQTIIPKREDVSGCSHSFTKNLPRVPATTKASGLTEGLVCEYCEFPEVEQETIPKIGTLKLSTTTYTYNGKTKAPTVYVKDINGNTIDKTNYKVTYSAGRKNPGTYYATVKFRNNYSGTHKLSFKIALKKPTVKTSSTTSTIKLTWSKVSSVSGYKVYSSSKSTLSDRKTSTSYTITKRSSGKAYTYYVRSYKKIGSKTYYSDYVKVSASTLPATPSVSTSSTSSSVKLSWKKVTGATGYVVYNSSKKKLSSTTSTSKSITGLSGGKTYTFYVRAYRTYNGKTYYSGYKKVSRTTLPTAPKLKYSPTSTTIKFYWGKVSGASGYCIYNQNKKLVSDRKASTSYTAKNLKKGGTYIVYVRAYRIVSGKRYYSSYTKLTASTTLATPNFKVSTSTSTSITYKASAVYGAGGYAIYNSSKKLLMDNISRSGFKVYELPVGAYYTCYFRAYKIIGNTRVYSAYQKVTYSTKPEFNVSSKTIGLGSSDYLKLTTTDKTITWSSSNSSIVSVGSTTGKITGKKVGTATIYASANGRKVSIKVTVIKIPTYSALGYSEVPDFGKAVGTDIPYGYQFGNFSTDGTPFLYLIYKNADINFDGKISEKVTNYVGWLNQKGIYYNSDDSKIFYYTKQTTQGLLVVAIAPLSNGDIELLIWYE